MSIGIDKHAKIWTKEVAICALRNVPLIGTAAEVAHSVQQQYINIKTEDRLVRMESELTSFQSRMLGLVESAVADAMERLQQPYLDGATLTSLVKEFNSINEAGYHSALFEGLFLGTPHHDSLKNAPQNYGLLLDPGAKIEPGHFPIIIQLEGVDRILAVPPASLSQILSNAAGQGKTRIVTSDDVFAIPIRTGDVENHTSADQNQHGFIEGYFDKTTNELTQKALFFKKRAESHLEKNRLGMERDLSYSEISDYDEALRLIPNDVECYYARGKAHARLADFGRGTSSSTSKAHSEAALSDFTEAIRLDPNNSELFKARGTELFSSRGKKHEEALADFNEVLRLDPNDSTAYFYRATIHKLKGNSAASLSDYSEALRIDPQKEYILKCRIELYIEAGDYEAAISDYTSMLSTTDYKIDCLRKRAGLYRKIHDYEAALSDYNHALQLKPNFPGYDLDQIKETYKEMGMLPPVGLSVKSIFAKRP